MNRFTSDISRAGRPGHQHRVLAFLKRRVLIGVVNVLNDVLRIEQNHDIVCQKANRVDLKFGFGEQTEPVSATPKGERTTVTSISAASGQLP
jgi:hypothetical protein